MLCIRARSLDCRWWCNIRNLVLHAFPDESKADGHQRTTTLIGRYGNTGASCGAQIRSAVLSA
jgi:hypothetical protein